MIHLTIGTAGHIDHGKTSLIKALTEIDCDTHKEEKERGITINLGFAHISLPNGNQIGVIDVPGHKDFINTMIAGASGIDLLLLVIAADSGIMPQTREHIQICQSLGIRQAIVALNKADLVDEEWIEIMKLEISETLNNTPYSDAPIIPVSSTNKSGLSDLLEEIQNAEPNIVPRSANGPFRLYIDRYFNIKGHGYVVTGSVISGSINSNDQLFMLPGNETLRIKGLQRFSKNVNSVSAGDRAAINLSGFKPELFKRGMILSNERLEGHTFIDCLINLHEDSKKWKKRMTCLFLTGTIQTQVKINLIDKNELLPGNEAIAQIQFKDPIILREKDRFILRSTSGDHTLAGGYVIDSNALHHRRPKPELIEKLVQLKESFEQNNSFWHRLRMDLEKENQFIHLDDLEKQYEEASTLRHNWEESAEFGLVYFEESSLVCTQSFINTIESKILTELSSFHDKNRLLENGLSATDLAGKLGIKIRNNDFLILESILKSCVNNRLLRTHKNQYLLYSFQTTRKPVDNENLEWLEMMIKNYKMNKVLIEEINLEARNKKINKELLSQYLNILANDSKIYMINDEIVHSSIVDFARKKLLTELKRINKGINEGDFRVLIDGTKKIIHPLLAIFINEGIIVQEKYIINITPKGENVKT